MTTNKDTIDDTIDISNRKKYSYYDKSPKTPEIEKQDREQTERDFALIRKDLEVLEILKPKIELMTIEKNHYLKLLNCDGKMIPLTQDEYNKLKEWLEDDEL